MTKQEPLEIPLVQEKEARSVHQNALFLFVACTILFVVMMFVGWKGGAIPILFPTTLFVFIFTSAVIPTLKARRLLQGLRNQNIVFDSETVSLEANSTVLQAIPLSAVAGYEIHDASLALRIYQVSGEPMTIEIGKHSGLPSLNTIVTIADALDARIPETASRNRGLGRRNELVDFWMIHGTNLPKVDLVDGGAYRYVNPSHLEKIARDGTQSAVIYSLIFVLPALAIVVVPLPNPWAFLAAAVLLCLYLPVIIRVVKRNREWAQFKRTIRGTFQAHGGGIKFSGDSRVFYPKPARKALWPFSLIRDEYGFETYQSGSETVLIARRHLRPAELPLTALSQTSPPQLSPDFSATSNERIES